ncbi:PDZ domain-containing protein [Streptomyces bullii]|uniref:PDZ domain-containing protein n=1 Tax=Streptomyces bullii TaxID=349910 RepID=A0ABW0UNY0_9ACTN
MAVAVGLLLVLVGAGLGAMGATVIGSGRLAEQMRQPGHPGQQGQPEPRQREQPGQPERPERSDQPEQLGWPEQSRHPGQPGSPSASARTGLSPSALPAPATARATLGVEVADARKPGALVVAVHIPGPGFSAGLVLGDVLLAFGTTRVDSAADLARAVAAARPGTETTLTVLHRSGGYQQLTVVPGVVT